MIKPIISIILVHYHCPQELIACIRSIEQTTAVSYELIIVDNDEEKILPQILKNEKIAATYITNDNQGYGQGCNTGSRKARGEYLFFLNPDTIIKPDCIDSLIHFLEKNKNYAAVAPLLLDAQNNPYPLQGTTTLTLLKAIFSLSFIHKIFPHNPIAKSYWNTITPAKKIYDVDVLPGTAFLIRRKFFDDVGGFDEQYFLYFEENDFFRRLRQSGKKLAILSEAKLIHLWGKSTEHNSKSYHYFLQSRHYYFEKWYGGIPALLTESMLQIGSAELLFFLIFVLGSWLRIRQVLQTPFFGDMGWFYLSARDALINNSIPLVGITSSHPWLHQGAWWTYLLMGIFTLSHFRIISPIYFINSIGILLLIFLYIWTKDSLGKFPALITTTFYAFSPLIIMNDRTAYHTSMIPVFSFLLLWSLLRFRDNEKYLPLITACIALLYEFGIATIAISAGALLFLLWDTPSRRQLIKILRTPWGAVSSLAAFLIPLLPTILYDIQHKTSEFVLLIVWTGYKALSVIPDLFSGHIHSDPSLPFFADSLTYIRQLLFLPNSIIATSLFIWIILVALFFLFRHRKNLSLIEKLIICLYVVPILLYFGQFIPSPGYIPMLFVGFCLTAGYVWKNLHRIGKIIMIALMVTTVLINSWTMLTNFMLMTPQEFGYSLQQRLTVIQNQQERVGKQSVSVIYHGPLQDFPSNRMNYEFLAWKLGMHVVQSNSKITLIVTDNGSELSSRVIQSKQ